VRAYRTVRKLTHALFPELAGNEELWSNIVEAGRQIAIATSYLGQANAKYAAAWEAMMRAEIRQDRPEPNTRTTHRPTETPAIRPTGTERHP